MADYFFEFNNPLIDSYLEDGLEAEALRDDEIGEEDEYDALNDETFGSEDTTGDWEKDHEKLAQITESTRPQNQSTLYKKNGVDINIEDNLSHLVLDEKEGIVPRPGVWDSPSSLSLPKPRPPLSLSSTLTNVCTVEEIEKGLIANRPPPGLTKPVQLQQQQQQSQQQQAQQQQQQQPHQQQQQTKSDGSLLFDTLSLNEKLQINGLPPPRFPPGLGLPVPPPVVLPPNMRFPHPQFIQHPRLLPNQAGNLLRYPLPPHLMLPHASQRQPVHGSFCGNFPQNPHTNLGPPPFLRADHGLMPPFSNNQNNHQQQQHPYPHMGNQRNQNRPYHHGEQQPNHQPFFKNNQYAYRNHDRHYHYHHHSDGTNGVTNSGEYDEYAGLMSNREKQWLINIQLLQLNTNEPYVDDYYYTVFSDRQNKQNANQQQKEKERRQQSNNNGYHRESRERDQNHQALSRVTWIPAQFENSLGKLQFPSVTAPRIIIDMDVVPNSDPQSATQLQQKDTKKTRQLLLEIERLYIIQLKLEDLSNPLAIRMEQQRQQQLQQQQLQQNEQSAQSQPVHDAPKDAAVVKKTRAELINMILTSLLQLIQEDKLASMLSIRKGKALLLRFLRMFVNVTEYHVQLAEVWIAVLRGLAIIGRRDSHILADLYTEFQWWLNDVRDFNTVLRLAKALSDSANQPIKNNSLAFALVNKFGVSVIASMVEKAEKLYPKEDSSSSAEWSNFIVGIVEIIGDTQPCVAPCQPIAANTLKQHLNRISNLKLERYATLELLLTNANPSR